MSKASTELYTVSRFEINSSSLSTVYLNLSLILMLYRCIHVSNIAMENTEIAFSARLLTHTRWNTTTAF